jgi:hypothetical protein
MGHLIEERNEAWCREDEARASTDELEFYVKVIEEHNNNLREELHVIQNRLHPYDNPAEKQQLSLLQLWEAGTLLKGVPISKSVQPQLLESSCNSTAELEPE